MAAVSAFRLLDTDGRAHVSPSGRAHLLVFAHAGCPTCELTLPLVEAAHEAFGAKLDVSVVAQDDDGGRALREKHGLRAPFLDDSALAVSFQSEIDAVPTTVLLGGDGAELERCVGFAREDWRGLFARMALLGGGRAPALDWSSLPELRPGCGSRTNDPEIAARLEARASGSPLRARRIEVGDADDPFEFMFDQGLTDGLPVVPPTPERVMRMLAGTRRAAQDVVAEVAPNYAPATVEKIAINAVMAGCKPAYLPVVIAAVEAVCTPEFNLHGVLATTFFPTPVLIVNGPIRARIGMNSGLNCLGQGNRANATIGRALQLVVRNLGGGRPGEVDRAALGQPGKFTMCFAEYEERSNWAPLHVERGFARAQSTVTAFAGGAPTGFIDQLARDGRTLATSYGLVLAAANHPKHYLHGEIVVVVPPEHVDTFARDGVSKHQLRARIQEVTSRPLRELVRDDACAEGLPLELLEKLGADARVAKFRTLSDITLVVAGGEAGKFGAYFQGWLSGPLGSVMTTRVIDADEGVSR
ncbi:MAG: TlpA family protein disulfide reductase [Myxococcota bacterium]